jgi:hypothetical protein
MIILLLFWCSLLLLVWDMVPTRGRKAQHKPSVFSHPENAKIKLEYEIRFLRTKWGQTQTKGGTKTKAIVDKQKLHFAHQVTTYYTLLILFLR